jgi:hypothetical protein
MSYTNTELVKKHINWGSTVSAVQRNRPITFSGLQWSSLGGRNIAAGSLRVKALRSNVPCREYIILGNEPVLLALRQVVSDSILVASDSSLGTIYVENIDLAVDPVNASIRRIANGNIAENSTVVVWYYGYALYEEGTDYSTNYAEGLIRRLAGSAIQDGQEVLADYELMSGNIDDDILAEAVSEANAIIEREIGSEQSFGADLALQTAATYMAVSLLCRIAAANDLSGSGISRTSSSAASWLALADNYRRDYELLIKPFRAQGVRMNRPTRT